LRVFVQKTKPVYIPNVFSPNNDGVNDVFFIQAGNQVARVRSFLVYSRWGETVHQYYDFLPNDPAYGWDGTHRGKVLNPAVFVYHAEIEFIDGRVELFKGDITLVR
jgi:gliding motility-associated-like protein